MVLTLNEATLSDCQSQIEKVLGWLDDSVATMKVRITFLRMVCLQTKECLFHKNNYYNSVVYSTDQTDNLLEFLFSKDGGVNILNLLD